jgi:hypothetical protein
MSLDINLTNVQSKAVVISTNQTAVNDANYTVVANATFTDPSPVEGKGYRVFVRNGTATINSVGYTVGTSIFRVFHSGAWVSYVSLPDSNFVPTTRTINGYDLSANRTLTASDVGAVATNSAITGATKTKITFDAKGLVTSSADATTADIADSSNKRYVTDAQLTVIGNTSNTNTGDETQSSILAKLGWWKIHDVTTGTASSGTSNTISKSIALPSVPTKLEFRAVATKTNSNGTFTTRVYLSEVDNNITGTAILIATLGSSLAGNNFAPIRRDCDIVSGNIKNTIGSTVSSVSDDTLSGIAPLNVAIPSGTPLYLIFAVQCTSGSDTARIEMVEISNF